MVMTDLERVLQGLDCVSGFGHCLQSEAFAGGICAYCIKEITKKAKELLKEQEAVKRTSRTGINGFSIIWTCGACGSDLHPNNAKAKYCSNCGRKVNWDA